METRYFDALVRSLGEPSSRRGLLGFLGALPLVGGLFVLLDGDESEAKGRRKRRKKRHKHGKGRDKGKHKKPKCKPHSKAKTCAGKCGSVKNNCKKSVDCGPCECASDAECETAGLGDLCCDGSCVDGECCDSSTCSNPAPTCIDNFCAPCDSSEQCPSGTICVDGLCEACMVCERGCDYATVQEAIDDPQAGATIVICPGTYGAITVRRPVRLVGAGDGEDDDNNTILDAQESGSVVATSFMTTVTLERLRITGGLASTGGAGVNNQGALTMSGCTVTGNSSTNSPGGGILNPAAGAITMTDCTVRGNHTTGEGLRNGGGIINNGSLTMTGCTVSDNICAGQGGGIQNIGTLTLNDCDVENNRAEGGDGGGIRTGGGSVTLNGGSVTDNFASGDGGGIFNGTLPDFGGVTLNDCTVTDNDPNDCAGNPVNGTCESWST